MLTATVWLTIAVSLEGSCEPGDELRVSLKTRKFLEYLSGYPIEDYFPFG